MFYFSFFISQYTSINKKKRYIIFLGKKVLHVFHLKTIFAISMLRNNQLLQYSEISRVYKANFRPAVLDNFV